MPQPGTLALIEGNNGNDLLVGTDASDTLRGGAGNDTLRGGLADDTLDGGSGTNQIDAGGGNDVILIDGTASNGPMGVPGTGIDAGTGFDTLVLTGTAAAYHVVTIVGSTGLTLQITDLTTGSRTTAVNVENVQFSDGSLLLAPVPDGVVPGSAQDDQLTGLAVGESLYGFDGADVLSGRGGGDHLDGGFGADAIFGGGGADFVLYDEGDGQVFGGSGADTLLIGTTATVHLSGPDHVIGDAAQTSGFEHVDATGSAGAMFLVGSNAGNHLTGGSAADVLTGGRGADVLTGGAAADRFVFASPRDSTHARPDAMVDFESGVDQIDLFSIDAVTGGTDNAFTFIGEAAFSAAGQLRYSESSGRVEGDIDGDGQADLVISLSNLPGLTSADFIL